MAYPVERVSESVNETVATLKDYAYKRRKPIVLDSTDSSPPFHVQDGIIVYEISDNMEHREEDRFWTQTKLDCIANCKNMQGMISSNYTEWQWWDDRLG